jgi:transposase
MLHLALSCKYYLYHAPADMRKGVDSLSGMVMQQMQMNVLGGDVFIFINKKRNQVKLLLWEGDGFSLYYKRLEQGTYELPAFNGTSKSINISAQQLHLLLSGISLNSVRKRKRYQHVA